MSRGRYSRSDQPEPSHTANTDDDEMSLEKKLKVFQSPSGDQTDGDSALSSIPELPLAATESYSITTNTLEKAKTYLQDNADNVKKLKELLVNQTLLLKDKTNNQLIKDSFEKKGLYDYDLSKYQHTNDDTNKVINNIVYTLKYINNIYLIVLNNESKETFKLLFEDENYNLNLEELNKLKEPPTGSPEAPKAPILASRVEQGTQNITIESVVSKLQEFIKEFNKNNKIKLKEQPNNILSLLTFENDSKTLMGKITPFLEDSRLTKFQFNLKNILLRIANAIIIITKTHIEEKERNALKKYLLKQIEIANNDLIKKEGTYQNEFFETIYRKLVSFKLTYNRLLITKDKYKLKDDVDIYYDTKEIKELSYEKPDEKLTFVKDKRWNDFKKENIEYIENSLQKVLIDINNAIISLNRAIKDKTKLPGEGEIIEKLKILDGKIDEAIKSIGLIFYITTDEARIADTKQKFKKGEDVRVFSQGNTIIATVAEYKEQGDTWTVNHNKDILNFRTAAMSKVTTPSKGGNPPTKYKSTGITVYILYEKKKYKRTVYTKDNRKTKYCKINNKYILLSKLNVIE